MWAVYIRLPSVEEAQRSIKEWKGATGIPGIVGAIDGTHIAIKKPSNCTAPEVYFNRKAFYNINVQGEVLTNLSILIIAMVDFKKRFVDVEAGWPGSVGDSRIFRTSRLNTTYIDWLSQFPTTRLVTGERDDGEVIYEDIPAFILADSAYPNSKHLVTTFKVTETSDEIINALNKKLGGARYHVENAFGILKARFRIFQRPLECAAEHIRFAITLISAIFVLHNFLIDVGDDSKEWDVDMVDDSEIDTQLESPDIADSLDGTTRSALLRHMRWTLENDD